MAQCKLDRPHWRATARFRGVAAKALHYATRICRKLPTLTSCLTFELELGGAGYVESLVRLQAEATADDFFHDLGGAAKALQKQ
jgi:hypothetical protein